MTKRDKLKQIIGEAVGEASMCWQPRPSHEVFSADEASGVVDRTVAAIEKLYAGSDFLSQALNEGDGVYRP